MGEVVVKQKFLHLRIMSLLSSCHPFLGHGPDHHPYHRDRLCGHVRGRGRPQRAPCHGSCNPRDIREGHVLLLPQMDYGQLNVYAAD